MAINHLADIASGKITRSNIIGIRKLLSGAWRVERGYSVGSTVPRNAPDLAPRIERAIAAHEPRAIGQLHDDGARVLQSPRWHKRFNAAQRAIIDDLGEFRLVRFDDVDRGHFVPVWRAVDRNGASFLFRNIPWQSAVAMGLESGPTIETE